MIIQSRVQGPLKEPIYITEWLIVFLAFEIAIIFWLRIENKNLNRLKSLQERAYCWIFFGYGMSYIFYIIGEYYVSGSSRLLFFNMGYLSQAFGALGFIYYMERYKIFIKKFLFTKIFAVVIIGFISIIIFAFDYSQVAAYVFYPIFIMFFMIYFIEIFKDLYRNKILANYWKYLILFIGGFFAIVIGYGFTTDFIVDTLGLWFRLAGNIFQISGYILLFIYFLKIPSFTEYDWKEKIDSLYITHRSGLFIYKKNFRGGEESPFDKNVIAGFLSSIKMMLEKVTDISGISILEKEGKIIIIQPSLTFTGILICEEKLKSLQILLNSFINKIEELYSKIMLKWSGDLNIFKPIEEIANEIFI
ncbi:MAG: hypothetical protein ACTSR8_17835 [Promethearchaeota archaeon]